MNKSLQCSVRSSLRETGTGFYSTKKGKSLSRMWREEVNSQSANVRRCADSHGYLGRTENGSGGVGSGGESCRQGWKLVKAVFLLGYRTIEG